MRCNPFPAVGPNKILEAEVATYQKSMPFAGVLVHRQMTVAHGIAMFTLLGDKTGIEVFLQSLDGSIDQSPVLNSTFHFDGPKFEP